MDTADLGELRNSVRVYDLLCREQFSLRRIGDEVGMSKQSVASRVKTLENQADRVATIAAYSPDYLDFLLRSLVRRSIEATTGEDGNPAARRRVQQDLAERLRLASEALDAGNAR